MDLGHFDRGFVHGYFCSFQSILKFKTQLCVTLLKFGTLGKSALTWTVFGPKVCKYKTQFSSVNLFLLVHVAALTLSAGSG